MKHTYMIGIDIGTSGSKTVIIDELGRVAAEDTGEYGLSIPQTGWCEQNPEDWWQAVRTSLSKLAALFAPGGRLAQTGEVIGIGLCGQMHGLVMVDGQGRVLRPCIIWADQRSSDECDEITQLAGGEEALLELTNNRMLTSYTGGKILWVRKHEPDLFERTRRMLNPKDYIRYRLTGEYATEVSDASGTGLFNVRERTWSHRLLTLLGLPEQLLPDCHESTEISGSLLPYLARELGLPENLPVVGGGGDAIIQSTGTGLVRGGVLSATIGTGGQICAALDQFQGNQAGRLQVFCNVMPGKWHAMGVMQTAGAALKWLARLLDEEQLNSGFDDIDRFARMDRVAARTEPGAKGLIFLPYLNGERCPHMDPAARGGFVGLNLQHGQGHLVRSVLEGVAFGLRDISGLIAGHGQAQASGQILFSGGGAKSSLWRQILADVLGKEVLTMQAAAYGGAYGAALVAGTGLGVWRSVEEAASLLVVETSCRPEPDSVETYNRLFPIYTSLYSSLSPAFSQLKTVF